MIKILHITNWYPGPWNLLETPFIKAHFAALEGRVRQALWHVQVREDQTRWRLNWGSTGLHEHFLVIDSRLPAGRVVEVFTLLMLIALRLRLGRRWWDLVNVHIAYPLLRFPRLFRWLFGQEVVVTEHWSAYHQGFYLPAKSPARLRIAGIFRHGLPVITVSNALMDDVAAFAGTDTFPRHVVPNVVDPKLFYPIVPPRLASSAVFLMVANWTAIKRPLLVMATFAAILPQYPHARLRIVGEGPQFAAMQEFVHRQGLDGHIRLLGAMDKSRVADELRGSDFFLHASAYETFSVVCAEALCCGLPVIASRVGGITEFVNASNGLLVDNTLEAWRTALLNSIGNAASWDREEIARKARERWNPEVVGDQLLAIYRQSCGVSH